MQKRFPDILQLRNGSLAPIDQKVAKKFACENPFFVCTISHTKTSEIPGITVAGANPQLLKYTSPADAEFLHYGECRCINGIPATPDGKPTPAVITRAAVHMQKIPFLVVEAGTEVKPFIPSVSLGLDSGKNIVVEDAMSIIQSKQAFSHASALGKQLARISDLLVIGESIPAGTTTALAVLLALGFNARFKVSSSMPENPHDIKNEIVAKAFDRTGTRPGQLEDDPFGAISRFGDPMIPSVAGLAEGALGEGTKVMLAGGTQMSCVLAILKRLGKSLSNICIGTTTYVAGDNASDISGLVGQISKQVPVLAADLHMIDSKKPGLQAFAKGFVKEGVGAGGTSIAAMLKSKGKVTGRTILKAIEKEYEMSIEEKKKKIS